MVQMLENVLGMALVLKSSICEKGLTPAALREAERLSYDKLRAQVCTIVCSFLNILNTGVQFTVKPTCTRVKHACLNPNSGVISRN